PVSTLDIVSVGCPANSVRARAFLSNGTIHDSDAGNTSPAEANAPKCNVVQTCIARVDKEISCDGGLTFHDVGFESADEDGVTDSCAGWNAHDTVAAEPITARYIVRNAGTASLVNCVVTDTNFTDAACPASGSPTGTSVAVAVSPSTIASLGHGSMTTATGTATGLTKDSCNTVSVTCEIVGSVDPANPTQRKKLTATAQDTCEACNVKIDKQIKDRTGQ